MRRERELDIHKYKHVFCAQYYVKGKLETMNKLGCKMRMVDMI